VARPWHLLWSSLQALEDQCQRLSQHGAVDLAAEAHRAGGQGLPGLPTVDGQHQVARLHGPAHHCHGPHLGRRPGQVLSARHGDSELVTGVEQLLAVHHFVPLRQRGHQHIADLGPLIAAEGEHRDPGTGQGGTGNEAEAEQAQPEGRQAWHLVGL
jgi:hypothetical protein